MKGLRTSDELKLVTCFELVNCVVLCTVCVYMFSVLLPPGGNPIAVKYTKSIEMGESLLEKEFHCSLQ